MFSNQLSESAMTKGTCETSAQGVETGDRLGKACITSVIHESGLFTCYRPFLKA